MSTWAAVLRLDGGEVGEREIALATESLRAVDATTRTWFDGPVVLAARGASGPVGDGERWLVGDLRLDAADRLARSLDIESRRGPARGDSQDADAETLLRAWRRWGTAAAARVAGDFAYASWHRGRRRLDIVRDDFGVRPLYWSTGLPAGDDAARLLVVSDSADTVARHPGLTLELDQDGVADLLLFDAWQGPEGTLWRHVHRLPPASRRVWTAGPAATRNGSAGAVSGPLPSRGLVRPRLDPLAPSPDPEETAEALWSALRAATADRLRGTRHPALLLSGGLDSAAVATAAVADGTRLQGHVLTYRRLLRDPEAPAAARTAAALGLPLRRHALDDFRYFDPGDEPGDDLDAWRVSRVPSFPLTASIDRALARRLRAMGTEVVLTGFGGDVVLRPDRDALRSKLAAGDVVGTVRALAGSLRRGLRPPLGLHSALVRRTSWRDGYPPWLEAGFARRVDALERWRHRYGPRPAASVDRSEAWRELTDGGWAVVFERWAVLEQQVGAPPRRHPFFDRRVVAAALAAASLPQCLDKSMLRTALRGRLPEAIRRRPKTPLVGEPAHGTPEPLERALRGWALKAPIVRDFVDIERLAACLQSATPEASPHRHAAAFCFWLSRLMVVLDEGDTI
ncbi:MAG: asparagine synthase-related protein [Acidobacteriota bacterium]